MFKNYLTIALRTLWRNKGYAAINSVGLSVAFCISIFLFLTAYLQLTFDSFHEEKDRIYQAYFFSNDPERASRSGGMPMPLAPTLKAEFEEVEAAARVMTLRKSSVAYQDKRMDKEVYMTDPDFLNMFSFPLLKGNKETAFSDLSSILISESLAQTLFGNDEPLGKVVQIGNEGKQKGYIVSGVLADAPYNSSIRYDAFIRIDNHPNFTHDQANWGSNSHKVFIKIAPQAKQATLENKLKLFSQKYFSSNIEVLQKKGAKPDKLGDIFALRLQPLTKVHFDTEISNGPPIAIVYALMGIAFFILLIACINFINLSVARSFTRAREVGVRKTLGALKSQLFVQIWSESTLLCFIGFLVGVLLAYQLLPEFNTMFNAQIKLAHIWEPGFIGLIVGVFFMVTLLAGGYPALLMAKFNPVEVLKGKISLKRPGFLRNSLIVMQFVMSSLLASCTLIALQQLDYLRTRPLGFVKEQVISIPVGNQENGRQVLKRMRAKLATDPTVLAVTGSGINLGRGKDRVTSRAVIAFTHKGQQIQTDWLLVDYDYLKTLQIPLQEGREFDPAYPSDSLDRIIISASMAKAMGGQELVGSYLRNEADSAGTKYQIIGVVPDFHLYNLSNGVIPITMHLSNTESIHYIFVRVASQNLKQSLDKLQHAWKEVAPQSEFIGTFLDENVNEWYREEEMLSQIFSLASGVAILLSCVGLFAMALLVTEQRTKEIGIRKVLGAGVPSLILLLSKDFIKLVLIALCMALPLAWFMMKQWLNEYPYRIEISLWIFVAVALAALLITFLTIGFQSMKAAFMNPVKSLRSE
ncbi:FtsX-like permease family protein [Rhodocytophaga rosea]|uniref:FtsX-like permease family protein n=2 Tax=Rhodocytophaga rosea TaxID=2704465 RepID=A0A6C0GWF7_9BACT|nr:FtsX-like permease family protein [Rhodocytophaga rosea]